MQLLGFITFLPILALCADVKNKCPISFGKNDIFRGSPIMFKLYNSEGKKKILEGINLKDEKSDRVNKKIHLGECSQCKFHLFSVPDGVIVIRCFEDNQGNLDCGYVYFNLNEMAGAKGYDGRSWNYNPFELTNSQIDTDKIFMRIFKENGRETWRVYFDYKQKIDIPREGRTTGIKANSTSDKDLIVIATCFDEGYKCVPDYSPYYAKREGGYPVRRTDRKDAVVAFHRMLFYKNDEGFFVDKVDKVTCYLGNLGSESEIFLPYFFQDAKEWTLYTETIGIYHTEKTCLDKDGVEKIRNQKRTLDEDDYDEYGALVSYSAQKSKCQHDTQTMFFALIAASVFAGLITLLLLGACIVVCIAKKRMLAFGKKLPGKPWETQATEDETTFIDQTVGATQMDDGVTSSYSTVA